MTETPRTRLSLKREAAPKLEERLHKVLAEAGLGSRRSLEERIAQGQVRVNQEVAQVGCVVKPITPIRSQGWSRPTQRRAPSFAS